MRVVTQLNEQPVTLAQYSMHLRPPMISIRRGRRGDLQVCYGGPDYLKFRGVLKAMKVRYVSCTLWQWRQPYRRLFHQNFVELKCVPLFK